MNSLSKGLTGFAVAGLMSAGAAFGQVTVTAPATTPPPTTAIAPPTNVQPGPVNIQSGPYGTSVAVPPGVGAGLGERIRENAVLRQSERQTAREDWRMRFYNRQWWYWNPNNTWSVYQSPTWVPYTRAVGGNVTPPLTLPVPPAVNQTTTTMQPGVIVRRGPLGLRRYSTGYRGYTTVAPVTPVTPTPPLSPTTAPMYGPTDDAPANFSGPSTAVNPSLTPTPPVPANP